jgi:hypothetical protein
MVRTVEQWREYLAEYSAEVLRAHDGEDDELVDVGDAQRLLGWLGFDGATAEQLDALERRLGTALPPSYRAFLTVSDGWLHISNFMWKMRTTDEAGWLRDTEPELCQILSDGGDADDADDEDSDDEDGGDREDESESAIVRRALLVSGAGDAQYWVLDPGDVTADGEWAAYIWASWYPGLGERHPSFAALVDAERESWRTLRDQDA